jgi:hypothetical protein
LSHLQTGYISVETGFKMAHNGSQVYLVRA